MTWATRPPPESASTRPVFPAYSSREQVLLACLCGCQLKAEEGRGMLMVVFKCQMPLLKFLYFAGLL